MSKAVIFPKVKDSEASPHITQKNVIMCRSGIQLYHKSELASFISEDNKPAVEKEWYREYRPANVVVRAKELCKALPVACEHPDEWITPDNFKQLAGGVTDNEVEVVALEGEAEGEIGLMSNITFFTRDLYDYYKEHKEVSLGYTVKKHFVPNPEEVGYDIILDEITEVNHLAITKSGRGGSSVAVIDSLIGGMKPMRTGIWAWLKSRKQTDSKHSFGKEVFDALRSCKGSTENELSQEMKAVFDSCAELKDCQQKTVMLDMIRDCYDNREKALENEKELTTAFDSMYVTLSGDSLKEIVDAVKGVSSSTASVSDSEGKNEPAKDGCHADEGKKDGQEDSDEGKKTSDEEKKDEQKDSDEEEKKEQKDSVKDSSPITKEEVAQIVKDSLGTDFKEMVRDIVKETLGIKDSRPEIEGGQIDSTPVVTRDYSEFVM